MAWLVVALFIFVGLGAAFADDWDRAAAAYDRQDYETVFRLMLPLAEQGDTVSQYFLGLMYFGGRGVAQDYSEAAGWYRKAADQGLADAQYNLGQMYRRGQGVARDYSEAVRWYRAAADQGTVLAQRNLGIMYVLGQGVNHDDVVAHKWYNIAAAAGDKTAAKYRDLIATYMTADQIAKAQRLAREWLRKPASGPL